MKRSLLLIAMFGMMVTTATADPFDTGDSYGPRSPSGFHGEGTGGSPSTAFETIPHSAAVILSADTTQADVDAQVRRNNEAGRASYDAVAREGGCNADFIPPSIAAYCWSRLVGSGTPSPQGPIGASMGGSD